MEQMKKMPLEGIRVVELATVVAAPTASRVLCAFGAEVIKVETKIGDEMRRAGEFEMVVCEDDKNPLFTIQNSGKRLTSIDLKNPDGKAAFLKLLETAARSRSRPPTPSATWPRARRSCPASSWRSSARRAPAWAHL